MTTATFLRAQASVQEQQTRNYAQLLYGFVQNNRSSFETPDLLLGAIRSRSWKRLLELADSMGGAVQCPAPEYLVRNQFALLVRKYPFTPEQIPGLDPRAKATEKFLAAETRCGRVNLRLLSNKLYEKYPQYEPYLTAAKRWISWTIGEVPNLPKIYELCNFGPGAAIGCGGDTTSMARKLLAESWTITRSAVPYALGALWANAQVREWLLSQEGAIYSVNPTLFKWRVISRLEYTEHNKIEMVPKTAKTHRAIAVEPVLNGYLQSGAGEYIAICLRQRGIDLSDQSKNQTLARRGSIPSSGVPYITLDLSSASDSLALAACKLLLPPEWYEFLMQLRVQKGLLDGKQISYSKMSSMGNGFTFPLETLIFSAICHAAAKCCHQPQDFSVYGDDIIVRQDLGLIVVELLNLIGFKVNRDKSFFHGPFRESCGADWLGGVDVRPIVVDKPLSTIEAVFTIHNATSRSPLVAAMFEGVKPTLRSMVPDEFRFLRPYPGQEDTAFEVPLDVFMGSGGGTWCTDEQRWEWRELHHRAVRDFDTKWRGSATLLAIAALRGSSPEVPYALRRKVKTTIVRTDVAGAIKRDQRRLALWRAAVRADRPDSKLG